MCREKAYEGGRRLALSGFWESWAADGRGTARCARGQCVRESRERREESTGRTGVDRQRRRERRHFRAGRVALRRARRVRSRPFLLCLSVVTLLILALRSVVSSFVLWTPDIRANDGRNEYVRSLREWTKLAAEVSTGASFMLSPSAVCGVCCGRRVVEETRRMNS